MISVHYEKAHDCLVCENPHMVRVIDFGTVPLADKLPETDTKEVPSAPLSLWRCQLCGHLQIGELVSPEILFRNEYPYLSSKIPEVSEHFRNLANYLRSNNLIDGNSFVFEVACNDGVFLRNFIGSSKMIFGVEPSLAPASVCQGLGIQVSEEFFGLDLATRLLKQFNGQHPQLLLACNVLSHVPNPKDFVAGLSVLTGDGSTLVLEVPYGPQMLKNGTFDSIFHQHCSYFSLRSLQRLLREYGLNIHHVELLSVQGGSLRLFVRKGNKEVESSVDDFITQETLQFYINDVFEQFTRNIEDHRKELVSLLDRLKTDGNVIVGYGAAGKSATLLNYYGINSELLDYLVDVSPTKHFKFFPFTGMQILPVETLEARMPDYVLVLAWNYTDAILASLNSLRAKGVKFIRLYPMPQIV